MAVDDRGLGTREANVGVVEPDQTANPAPGGNPGFWAEFRKKDWSIYAQWVGLLSGILCLATGFGNIFSFKIAWSLLAILFGFFIAILEVHWLVRLMFKCCPNKQFDDFRDKAASWFTRNEMRAGAYLVMSACQWASLSAGISSLLANAIVLLAASLCYAWPAFKRLPFTPSPALGSRIPITAFML